VAVALAKACAGTSSILADVTATICEDTVVGSVVARTPSASDDRPASARRNPVNVCGHRTSEWGLYLWLSAVIGARRGEVVALQWDDIDLAGAHQMRRVSIDAPTVTLPSSIGTTARRACT
jgi:integrase